MAVVLISNAMCNNGHHSLQKNHSFIRFDDANTIAQRMESDKAAPIRDIWTMLNSNQAKHYRQTEHLTIE